MWFPRNKTDICDKKHRTVDIRKNSSGPTVNSVILYLLQRKESVIAKAMLSLCAPTILGSEERSLEVISISGSFVPNIMYLS